ncbi:MAG: 50S ribosomal protein L24 [Dehalococcoidia bacterium]|jgi:large subunit ribosomal protein L24
MKIRKEDTVLVIVGKDKGKKGKIRQIMPKDNVLIVEGVNVIKRHMKPRAQARQAGIIEREAPVQVSNVMLICPKCGKPVRIRSKILEDGKRVRVCGKCDEVIN